METREEGYDGTKISMVESPQCQPGDSCTDSGLRHEEGPACEALKLHPGKAGQAGQCVYNCQDKLVSSGGRPCLFPFPLLGVGHQGATECNGVHGAECLLLWAQHCCQQLLPVPLILVHH